MRITTCAEIDLGVASIDGTVRLHYKQCNKAEKIATECIFSEHDSQIKNYVLVSKITSISCAQVSYDREIYKEDLAQLKQAAKAESGGKMAKKKRRKAITDNVSLKLSYVFGYGQVHSCYRLQVVSINYI